MGSSGSIEGSMRSAGSAATAGAAGGGTSAVAGAGAADVVAARSTYTALNTSVVIQRLNGVLAQ